MNKFVVRMLELGSELDKAVSPIEISMVINDAEILYKNHIEQLTIPVVVNSYDDMTFAELSKIRKERISELKKVDKKMKEMAIAIRRSTAGSGNYKF